MGKFRNSHNSNRVSNVKGGQTEDTGQEEIECSVSFSQVLAICGSLDS